MLIYEYFSDLYNGFKRNEVAFCILEEVAKTQLAILEDYHDSTESLSLGTIIDIKDEVVKRELDSFDETLGGYIYICENEDDLYEIIGVNYEWEKTHGRPPNITDIALSWDYCNFIPASNWAFILNCVNNSGGPTYFIHRSLWKKAKIEEHIKLTNMDYD